MTDIRKTRRSLYRAMKNAKGANTTLIRAMLRRCSSYRKRDASISRAKDIRRIDAAGTLSVATNANTTRH